ncbi:MAG: hypothetical protein KDC76_13640, partial [Bacteroidetes bacterium]|nr:hypothetical protein [Bacteroidota bacterium]
KPLNYLLLNRRSILIESAWMFFILIVPAGIIHLSEHEHFLGSQPIKYLLFSIIFSIPTGIGSHFINKRLIKKVRRKSIK